ncbi:MAG: MqnA/MqnD/SBP family protein [Acidobacteriota bacterium]|nr:ABC transporter substrate-binding protein [Blastocatellia bacterium]MDW8238900.1 MqnA/MqnD/SBP family protein [Acidobacteriota bacterium]
METRHITIAHSPDSDDAFMFYALATGKLDTGHLTFSHVLTDIETLNRKALDEVYDVTAVSIHAYAYIADKYLLLPSGASMGEQYGPIVVSARPLAPAQLRGKRLAVPGLMTTAYLVMKLFEPDVECEVMPFDRIIEAVAAQAVDAGLLIHEGQLTYAEEGLHKVIDLGHWWYQQTRLPLPLGGNVIKRSLGPELIAQIAQYLRQSIQYGLAHREEALAYALSFARGMSGQLTDRFIEMYVNDLTLDYGDNGREAVQRLLDMGHERGFIPHRVQVEFAA